MYEKFDKFGLGDYPPEIRGRFNSFITTQFDDSLSVEMQLRSIIKWAKDNFDETVNQTNHLVDFINDLIEYMNEFIDTFDDRYQETILDKMQEWYDNGELETLINESLDTKYHEMDERLSTQLEQLSINVKTFGAIGNGVTDDTIAIQEAIDSVGTRGAIYFPRGTYLTSSPLYFPENAKGIKLFSNVNAEIKAEHNGDLFVMSFADSNQGYNILEGLRLSGPNRLYPDSGYNPPSNGAGIRMLKSYYNVVRDCYISGFDVGVYMQNAIKTRFEGKTYIRHNQIGVLMDGQATNANNFNGVSIRENRKRGVLLRKHPGENVFPTANTFDSCLIESNTPYPYVESSAPTNSVAIELDGVYDNKFTNCYSENQEIAVLIKGSSDGNIFTNHRTNRSGSGDRVEKIVFEGTGLANNTFIGWNNTTPSSDINVEYLDGTTGRGNLFIDCFGLTFSEKDKDGFDIQNLRSNSGNHGDVVATLGIPSYGYGSNIADDGDRVQLQGIGTENATLHANGYGEVSLGGRITAPTTITSIEGMYNGNFLIIHNYQTQHPVHIKSSTSGTSGIVLNSKSDATLAGYGDVIVLYKTHIGRIVEVGRNINNSSTKSNATSLKATETTVTVEHKFGKTPNNVQVTPLGNLGSIWVSDVTDTHFTINCSEYRNANTRIDWFIQ